MFGIEAFHCQNRVIRGFPILAYALLKETPFLRNVTTNNPPPEISSILQGGSWVVNKGMGIPTLFDSLPWKGK